MTKAEPLTACKQYCLAAGATQGNIAYTQTVMGKFLTDISVCRTQHQQDRQLAHSYIELKPINQYNYDNK
jgi:hypothetical protein